MLSNQSKQRASRALTLRGLIVDCSGYGCKDPDVFRFFQVLLGDVGSSSIRVRNTWIWISGKVTLKKWRGEVYSPGKSTKTAPVDRAFDLQNTCTSRIKGQ